VSLITAYLALNSDVSLATVGVMVAVLPRTLQLLGSAHSISVISSRFFLYKAKHHMLQAFWHQIEALDTQTVIKWDDIEIRRVCDRQIVRPDDLLDVTLQNGRYVVTGPNGSGKSSYLKQLMTQSTDAIFIGPDNSLLLPEDDGRSTGEKVSDMLSMILQDAPRLVLLDEWDANLDVKRRSTFNDHIELMSKTRIVVEVRHGRQPERNQNML
jgi:ABC-type transport system involved in cytochrome bd biosynthesis fused ATPase/permease subunit